MRTYYQILGVSPTADREEIKTAFKKLAFALHPDKNPGDEMAEEQFKQVNEAYQILSNHQKRASYDLRLYYASQPPLPQYPEYETQQADESRSRNRSAYQSRPYAYGRPRYAPRVEYEPAAVRKMAVLVGVCLVSFVIAIIYFAQFMNRLNAEDRYEEAMQEGKTYSAMLKLSEAIGYDQEYWEAYYQRGKLRMELLSDYQHAYSDFNSAIRYADTVQAPLYYNRGICSYQLRQYPEALEDFNQAIQLDSRNGTTYYLRCLTLLQLKDTVSACRDWRQAVQRGVDFPEDALADLCK